MMSCGALWIQPRQARTYTQARTQVRTQGHKNDKVRSNFIYTIIFQVYLPIVLPRNFIELN